MRLSRLFLLGAGAAALGAGLLPGQAQFPAAPKIPPSVPLVLTGGTVVDVSGWGRSAKDQPGAIVVIRDGRIVEVGNAMAVTIPKGARVIDCTGKYLIPGLIDGYAGMSSQGQANANLYMGVTTVVAVSDARHGVADTAAQPSPHLYLVDSVGVTDNWSLLAKRPEWALKLREGAHPAELSPEDTVHQLIDSARQGTRVLYLGHHLTAANTQWIIARARQLGLVTYGEFVSTPYNIAINAGVDALLHMGRYELGVIPDELQRPLVDDPEGSAASTALDYAERLPPTDLHVRAYARFLATHHAALAPTFSVFFARLPEHRNLWNEPAARLIDPAHLWEPTNPATGEMDYPLSSIARRLPGSTQRWLEDSQRKKADQSALRLWRLNETLFSAFPHYLAASGAPVNAALPGISLHVELELLVRLGLTPREALAAATNNYADQFGWYEIGQISPGRHADILVLDADPTANIWNARRISAIVMDGNILDRDALLNQKK
ncbi:MAG: amidohydrolase family protein [Terracidiphilus sp.]